MVSSAVRTSGALLQDKLLRTRMLECLALVVRTWLRRQGLPSRGQAPAAAARERAERWLAKATRPVVGNLRKGNFQFPEQEVGACCSLGLSGIAPPFGWRALRRAC